MAEDATIRTRWMELGGMERTALCQAWGKAFGQAPPPFLSMDLMRKALIWHAQSKRLGGLRADQRRALRALAEGKTRAKPKALLRPGTQLVREWNGRRYQVEVTEDGFRMEGRVFRSLSAIARDITGSKWSGPRFFGLTSPRGAGR